LALGAGLHRRRRDRVRPRRCRRRPHILLLLRELRARLGLTMVFISHDLSVVRVLCDDVAILQHGEVVEYGTGRGGFSAPPQHAYTRQAARCDFRCLTSSRAGSTISSPIVPSLQQGSARMNQDPSRVSVVVIHRGHRPRSAAGRSSPNLPPVAPPRSTNRRAGHFPLWPRPASWLPVKMDVTSDDDVSRAAAVACRRHALDQQCRRQPQQHRLLGGAGTLRWRAEEIEANYLAPAAPDAGPSRPRADRQWRRGAQHADDFSRGVNLPFMGSYCASKAAGPQPGRRDCAANWDRRESASLRRCPGAVDTRMTAMLTIPKNDDGPVARGGDPRWIRGPARKRSMSATWRAASPKVSRMIRRRSNVNLASPG